MEQRRFQVIRMETYVQLEYATLEETILAMDQNQGSSGSLKLVSW